MKATVKNGVFTLVSELTKKDLESNYAKAVATDENGAQVYAASYSAGSPGSLSGFEIKFNTIVDGKLALTIITGEKKAEAVKKELGVHVVTAQKYLPIIAANLASATAAVNNAFDSDDSDAVPETDAE